MSALPPSAPAASAPTPTAPPKPHKGTLINHPTNGGLVFATVPTGLPYGLTSGDIYLKHGEHRPPRGYGLIHVWEGHKDDLLKAGYASMTEAARYIADIIRAGAPIYYEGSTSRDQRLAVVRSALGIAIIEHKPLPLGNLTWSVVTAYPKPRAQGKLVGKLQ